MLGLDARAIGILLILAVFAGYSWFLYDLGGDNRENSIYAAQAKAAEDAQTRALAAARDNEVKKRERAERDRSRNEEVNAYVTTDAAREPCFDADGYELFNAAGSAMPVPGSRSATVPAPATEGSREHARRRPSGTPR